MRFLFSCLGGSNLYGTAHPQSDRDIKRVFLPDKGDLLLGYQVTTISVKTNTIKGKKNSEEDTDTELIPIHKFARDFLHGQTYALELAWAVEYDGAEQEIHDPRFRSFCRQLRSQFMTSSVSAMAGYADEQARKYSDKGGRLNALKGLWTIFESFPAKARLSAHREALELAVRDLSMEFPEHVELAQYDVTGKGVMGDCIQILDRTLPYSGTFEYHLRTIRTLTRKYGNRAQKAAEDLADWKATMHAVRVIDEGIRLFTKGDLVFPFSDPDYIARLHQIRLGEIPYESIVAEIDAKTVHLNALKLTSGFPEISPELAADLEKWLLGWLEQFYQYNVTGILPRHRAS